MITASETKTFGERCKTNLRACAYGPETFPALSLTLVEVLARSSNVVLYYVNQRGTYTAEYMEFSSDRQVVRAVATYTI